MKNNIILIGMMGSGKTTIARELATNLNDFKLVDIDEEIEQSTGKKISEIFLKFGERHFRLLEEEKIRHACENSSQIIAVGGGAFENPDNRSLLLNCGKVIYLKALAEEIFERIKHETHRPLLKKNFSIERINSLLKARETNYKKAHIQIDTNGKTPYNIVKEILGVVNG